MESRVEDSYLGHTGHKGLDGLDAGHVGRIVEGRDVIALADLLFDFIVDEDARAEFLAAVDDTVADSVDFGVRLDAAFDGVGQHLEDGLDRTFVVGAAEFDDGLAAVGALILEEGVGQTDFFDTAFSESGLGVSVDEFIFYRAAARIQYENFHD